MVALDAGGALTATGLDETNIYRNFIVTSDDDGVTWAAPLDVTRTTKRPTRATTIASGPGAGIQLTRGPHAGRLLIPFNEGPYGKWQNYAVFSDDAGKSWTYGDDVPGALVPDWSLLPYTKADKTQWPFVANPHAGG